MSAATDGLGVANRRHDLSGLERAAALAGLGEVEARIAPFDARVGWWFRWGRGTLQVSERIVERCVPGDAEALLVNAVIEGRKLRTWKIFWTCWWVFVVAFGAVGTLGGPDYAFLDGWGLLELGLFAVGAVVVMFIQRQQFRLKADDATVALMGDAEALVRGLNAMGQEELRFGSMRMAARPDLHKRAERLVAKHALCSAAGGPPSDSPPSSDSRDDAAGG